MLLKVFLGSINIKPAHSRGGLVTFVLAKVTKTVSAEMLLCCQGPSRTSRKNSEGCNLFAVLSRRFNTLHAKSCYALAHFIGLLFFLLFPEAVLLTGDKYRNLNHIIY
ncbi:MAG TPA: hypothetical protein VGI43_12375 [Mucilaginibacter sp.]|jgi:hypothetical protein